LHYILDSTALDTFMFGLNQVHIPLCNSPPKKLPVLFIVFFFTALHFYQVNYLKRSKFLVWELTCSKIFIKTVHLNALGSLKTVKRVSEIFNARKSKLQNRNFHSQEKGGACWISLWFWWGYSLKQTRCETKVKIQVSPPPKLISLTSLFNVCLSFLHGTLRRCSRGCQKWKLVPSCSQVLPSPWTLFTHWGLAAWWKEAWPMDQCISTCLTGKPDLRLGSYSWGMASTPCSKDSIN
jgi:hypothetical protein